MKFYENPDSNKILNYHVDKWIKEILDLEISFTTNESIDIILNGFKDKIFLIISCHLIYPLA